MQVIASQFWKTKNSIEFLETCILVPENSKNFNLLCDVMTLKMRNEINSDANGNVTVSTTCQSDHAHSLNVI
jgi:hypothetical protein